MLSFTERLLGFRLNQLVTFISNLICVLFIYGMRDPNHIQPFFCPLLKGQAKSAGIESLKYFSPAVCSTVTAAKRRGVVMEEVEWTN